MLERKRKTQGKFKNEDEPNQRASKFEKTAQAPGEFDNKPASQSRARSSASLTSIPVAATIGCARVRESALYYLIELHVTLSRPIGFLTVIFAGALCDGQCCRELNGGSGHVGNGVESILYEVAGHELERSIPRED